MAHIKGPEGRENLPPTQLDEKQSPLAVRENTSKEQLLSTHLEKGGYKFHTIPLIGGILKALFGDYFAKKSALNQLKKKFVANIKELKNPEKLADKTFSSLKNCSLEDMKLVERFLDKGGSPLFFFNMTAKNMDLIRKIPEANLKTLGESFHLVTTPHSGKAVIELTEMAGNLSPLEFNNHVESMKIAQQSEEFKLVDPTRYNKLASMISLTETVAQMFGKRFTAEEQKRYQQDWLNLASSKEITHEEFNNLATKFQNYCKEVQQIQNERPTVYLAEEKKSFVSAGRDLQQELSVGSRFLATLSADLIDRSVVVNHQVLGENIGSFTKPPSMSNRTAPILDTRSNSSYSLSREIHPDLTIYEDGEELIDLTGSSTRTSITDEHTGETRTIHIPLPLGGQMSKTDARKLLRVLEATTHIPEDFGKEYDREELPAELKEQTKEAFLQWRDQALRGLGALILDFNATNTRPIFSTAREQPEMQRAITQPKEESYAREAAKGQNIFLLADDKTLSLLPPEIASNYPSIGQISQPTLENVKNALINNNEESISIELPDATGTLTLKQTLSQELEENQVIWVEMTITQGDNSYTRKVLYQGESIQPYAESGRLQRDLLLAKSEFLEHVDRNGESLAHLQPALKDFSPTDRAVILNFLLSPGGKIFAGQKELDPKLLLNFLKSDGGKNYAKVLADHPSNAINPAALLAVLKRNPEGIQLAFQTYPTSAQMMGNRFSEADHVDYMNAWIEMASNMNAEDFQNALQEFKAYTQLAADIQNERPKMYGEADGRCWGFQEHNALLVSIFNDYPLLQNLVREIKNETIVSEHPVALNIKMLYAPEEMRSSPALQQADQNNPFSLSKEITLLENSTNFYFTDEKTMETRCVRIPLPNMPEDNRKAFMDLLYLLMEQGPVRFEEEIAKFKLSKTQNNKIKNDYFQFVDQVRKAVGKSVFDFNATRSRPAFSFVREEKSMAESIQNPKSLPLQINAAKLGNIFLLKDGSLSLLPQESANPKVGQITKDEFQKASKVLSKNGTFSITLPEGAGDVSFASTPINVKDNPFLHLETKVKQGVNEQTRVTLYPMGNKNVPQKLQELAGSKLLEREILLAKSEFMNAHL